MKNLRAPSLLKSLLSGVGIFALVMGFLWTSASCSPTQEGFLKTAQDSITPAVPDTSGYYLIITGSTANHVVVAKYDLDATTPVGQYITDLRAEGDSPRGLAAFDTNSFILSAEASDSLYKIGLDGSKSIFHASSNLAGNLFDIAVGPLGYFYAIETNNIEVFDRGGVRLSTSVISTTTGACTLSTPRSMTVNSGGELLVTNTGGTGQLLYYNISTPTATCVRAVNIGNTPVGIKAHSNGKIYIGTQANDRIVSVDADGSNLTTIWNTNTAIINDPSAIVEMPNGDLLVASSATSTIERIAVDGTRIGVVPFIRDSFSLTITDMIIISKADGHEL